MCNQRKWTMGVGALLVLLAATAVAVGLGAVDVSATTPHSRPVAWALRAIMERSVRERAEDVHVPAGLDLTDPELGARAFGHYSAACRTCHGAPGANPDPWMIIYPAACATRS